MFSFILVFIFGQIGVSFSYPPLQKNSNLPDITLASQETQIIELNDFYSGNLLNFTFLDPHNENFSFLFEPSYMEKSFFNFKNITKDALKIKDFLPLNQEIILNHKIYCIGLTQENVFLSFIINLGSNTSYLVTNEFKAPSNISCNKMQLMTNISFLANCWNEKNEMIFFDALMQIDDNAFSFYKTMFTPVNFSNTSSMFPILLQCAKSFKVSSSYIFVFCKATESYEASNLIYLLYYDKITKTIQYFDLIDSIKIGASLNIQDISFTGIAGLFYLLDYLKGVMLLIYDFDSKNCSIFMNYTLIDSNFYGIAYINNYFLGGYLLISSQNYLTELTIDSNYNANLSKRIIYESLIETQNLFYSETHYFILGNKVTHNKSNSQSLLLTYERFSKTSFLIEKVYFEQEESVFFLNINYLLEDDKNIFIHFKEKGVLFFNIASPKLFLSSMLPKDYDDIFVNLSFSIYNRDNSAEFSKRSLFTLEDFIFIRLFNLSDTTLKFSNSQNISLNYSLVFPYFEFSFENLVKGPAKIFSLKSFNASHFSAEIDNTKTTDETNSDLNTSNVIFMRFFNDDEDHFYRILQTNDQYTDFSICSRQKLEKCMLIESLFMPFLIKEIIINTSLLAITWKENSSLISLYYFGHEIFEEFQNISIPSDVECDSLVTSQYSTKSLCLDEFNSTWYLFSLFGEFIQPDFVKIYEDFERYSKVDITLIEKNIIIAASMQKISVFTLDPMLNQAYLVGSIDNIYMHCGIFLDNCFDFKVFLANENNHFDLRMILINYDQNVILEYMINNILNPQFLRKIPLYDYKLIEQYPILFANGYLLLIAQTEFDNRTTLLNFDFSQQTEDILTKTVDITDLVFQIIEYITNDQNFIEFLIINPEKNTIQLFQISDFIFSGEIHLENVSISGEFINNSLHYNATFNETQNITLNTMITNEFNANILNLPILISFQFQEIFLNFSQMLFSEPNSFTNLYFSQSMQELKLKQYFSGPIIDYLINKSEGSKGKQQFYLKKMIEWDKVFDLDENRHTRSRLILDTTLIFDLFFILDLDGVKVFNLSNGFELQKVYNIPQYYQCDKIFQQSEKEPFLLLFPCNNYKTNQERFYFLNFTSEKLPNDLNFFDNQTFIYYDLKLVSKWLFIVKKTYENLNESHIDIFEIDESGIIFLDSITAESFGFDYLYVELLNLQILSTNQTELEESSLYGMMFVQDNSIVYCEFFITNGIVSDLFNINQIEFLDILDNLNDYKIFQIDNNLTKILNLYWKKVDSTETYTVIVSSNYHIIQVEHKKNNFSMYSIKLLYLTYLQCENFDSNFVIFENFLINSCKFTNYDFNFSPDKYYLTLYNINENSSTRNPFNKTHVLQALTYDFYSFSDFFIYKSTNGNYNLYVFSDNMSMNAYTLNESAYLVRQKSSQIDDVDDFVQLTLSAFNDFSNISIKIVVRSHIDPIEITYFVIFVIIPLIFAIVCIFATHFGVNISRIKRKEMIMEQFIASKDQKNHEFEVNWLGSHGNLE